MGRRAVHSIRRFGIEFKKYLVCLKPPIFKGEREVDNSHPPRLPLLFTHASDSNAPDPRLLQALASFLRSMFPPRPPLYLAHPLGEFAWLVVRRVLPLVCVPSLPLLLL